MRRARLEIVGTVVWQIQEGVINIFNCFWVAGDRCSLLKRCHSERKEEIIYLYSFLTLHVYCLKTLAGLTSLNNNSAFSKSINRIYIKQTVQN